MRKEILSINDFNADAFEEMYRLMSSKRQQRADSYKNKRDRLLCILSDYLSRRMISESLGKDMGSVVINIDDKGKPCTEGIYFNYSHSGEKVAVCVSTEPVGIDIEKVTDRSMKATVKFATENELEFIGDSIKNYLHIWTLKEAYFKCLGTGLRNDLKSVEFKIIDGVVSSSVSGFELETAEEEGYIISTCIKTTEADK